MSISKRKLAANRANSQKSTGPTSSEGKQKVLLNAIQHGLCGRFRVLANEKQDEYDDLVKRLMEAEQPANHTERELVAKMARHTWLSERAMRFQEACFLFQPQTPEEQADEKQTVGVLKDLDLYLRYQAANDRAYQRAANELIKRRKDRMFAERGFVQQKHAQAEEKRREERQNQHREMHFYRVETAKARLESKDEPAGLSEAKIQGQRRGPKPQIPASEPEPIAQTAS